MDSRIVESLERYGVLTFDVFGTLIDWEPHIVEFLRASLSRLGVTANDGDVLARYDAARAEYQIAHPSATYPEVLAASYDETVSSWGVTPDAGARREFASSIGEWEPYPDSVESLRYLSRHYRLGALSNIDDASFRITLEELHEPFTFVVTAERAGAYKPALPHFVHAVWECGRLGVDPDRILHVAQSLRADIRPANLLGLDCVWVDRPGRGLGRTGYGAEDARPDLSVPDIETLVRLHRDRTGETG